MRLMRTWFYILIDFIYSNPNWPFASNVAFLTSGRYSLKSQLHFKLISCKPHFFKFSVCTCLLSITILAFPVSLHLKPLHKESNRKDCSCDQCFDEVVFDDGLNDNRSDRNPDILSKMTSDIMRTKSSQVKFQFNLDFFEIRKGGHSFV